MPGIVTHMRLAVLATVGLTVWMAIGRGPQQSSPIVAAEHETVMIAAPGRIEGATESTEVGTSANGLVDQVLVKEGDSIRAGQVLARLDCRELVAEMRQRTAELAAARAVHLKLANGARREDILAAKAELDLAEARVVEAQEALRRHTSLQRRAIASKADFDVARRDARIAVAQEEAAKQRLAALRVGTRPEEIAEALARLEAAEAAAAAARERQLKCDVLSPIDGVVLKKLVSRGELVSQFIPRPLFHIADTARTRVRAEVDERDIARLRVGAKVTVVIGGSVEKRLPGKLAELGRSMGRRRVLTGDPAEKSDRDVLEVLIDLDVEPASLPIGFRVSVIIDPAQSGR